MRYLFLFPHDIFHICNFSLCLLVLVLGFVFFGSFLEMSCEFFELDLLDFFLLRRFCLAGMFGLTFFTNIRTSFQMSSCAS